MVLNWRTFIYLRHLHILHLCLVQEVLCDLWVLLPQQLKFLLRNRPILALIQYLQNELLGNKSLIHLLFGLGWHLIFLLWFHLLVSPGIRQWQGTILDQQVLKVGLVVPHRHVHRCVTLFV